MKIHDIFFAFLLLTTNVENGVSAQGSCDEFPPICVEGFFPECCINDVWKCVSPSGENACPVCTGDVPDCNGDTAECCSDGVTWRCPNGETGGSTCPECLDLDGNGSWGICNGVSDSCAEDDGPATQCGYSCTCDDGFTFDQDTCLCSGPGVPEVPEVPREDTCAAGPYIPFIEDPEDCADTRISSKCRKWDCVDELKPFGDPRCKSRGWDLDDAYCGCGESPHIPFAYDTGGCEGTRAGEVCTSWICPYGQIPSGFAVCTSTGEWNIQAASCGCPHNTIMYTDGSCRDIDECATPMARNCISCHNFYGGYYCDCDYGYYFSPGQGCVAAFNQPNYNVPQYHQELIYNHAYSTQ